MTSNPGPRPPRRRSVAVRKFKTFGALPYREKLLLAPAFLVLGLTSLAIALLPFRWLSPMFGRHLGAAALVPLASEEQQRRAALFRRIISLSAAYMPLRSDCYAQAVTAVLLCRCFSVPYVLHFGAAPPGSSAALRGYIAHAWVTCGPIPIAGGRSFDRCATVACYVSPELHFLFRQQGANLNR
jgi:hypothetical protein